MKNIVKTLMVLSKLAEGTGEYVIEKIGDLPKWKQKETKRSAMLKGMLKGKSRKGIVRNIFNHRSSFGKQLKSKLHLETKNTFPNNFFRESDESNLTKQKSTLLKARKRYQEENLIKYFKLLSSQIQYYRSFELFLFWKSNWEASFVIIILNININHKIY